MNQISQDTAKAQEKSILNLRNQLGPAILYDQLAEECCELAQAALKQSRYIRQLNPTEMEQVDIVTNVNEEVSDVLLCLDVLGLSPDIRLMTAKLERWDKRVAKRFKEMQEEMEKAIKEKEAENGPEPNDDDGLE